MRIIIVILVAFIGSSLILFPKTDEEFIVNFSENTSKPVLEKERIFISPGFKKHSDIDRAYILSGGDPRLAPNYVKPNNLEFSFGGITEQDFSQMKAKYYGQKLMIFTGERIKLGWDIWVKYYVIPSCLLILLNLLAIWFKVPVKRTP